VSVLLALVAAAFFGLAAVLQQRGALKLPKLSLKEPSSLLELLRQRLWLLGTLALFVGFAVQAAALDRGRIVVIQPLLATTILFALLLGWLMTDQRIGRRQVVSSVVVIVGLTLFVMVGNPAGGRSDAPTFAWAIVVVSVSVICFLLLLYGTRGGPVQRAAAYGAVAGLLFGLTASMTKPLVEKLHLGVVDVVGDWRLYVLIFGGLLAFACQQISLGVGRLAPSVATVSILNPMLAILLGITLLEERLSRPPWHIAVAIVGLIIGLAGTFVIAMAQEEDLSGPDADGGSNEASAAGTGGSELA
jgi:uncharacterized membrane protein